MAASEPIDVDDDHIPLSTSFEEVNVFQPVFSGLHTSYAPSQQTTCNVKHPVFVIIDGDDEDYGPVGAGATKPIIIEDAPESSPNNAKEANELPPGWTLIHITHVTIGSPSHQLYFPQKRDLLVSQSSMVFKPVRFTPFLLKPSAFNTATPYFHEYSTI